VLSAENDVLLLSDSILPQLVCAAKKQGAACPNVLDNPRTMSLYERESLAAEAKIKAMKRRIKKKRKTQ
jgi:hypothetical protein